MPIQNIQGLRGLSAQERSDWESQQLNVMGFDSYTEGEKDRLYRNQKFAEAFKDDERFEEYKSWTPAERDRLYANRAFKERFGNRDDFEALKSANPADRDRFFVNSSIMKEAEDLYSNSQDWNIIKGLSPEIIKTNILDTGYQTSEKRAADNKIAKDTNRKITLDDYDFEGKAEKNPSFLEIVQGVGSGSKATIKDKAIAGIDLVAATTTNNPLFKLKAAHSTLSYLVNLSDNISKELPEGDTTANRINAFAKSVFSDVLYSIGSTVPAAFRDVWNSLEADSYGNLSLKKGVHWQDSELFKLWHDADRRWLSNYNDRVQNNILETAIAADNEFRVNKAANSDLTNFIANQFTEQYMSQDGPAQLNSAWEEAVDNSAYGREFKDTKFLNITDAEKIDLLSTYTAMRYSDGDAIASRVFDGTLRNIIADGMTTNDKCRNLTMNVLTQTAGVIGNFVTGAESMVVGLTGEENQNNFHDGTTMDWYKLWRDPVYWNSISQYGTFDPREIRRIKYGVGTSEYEEAFLEYAKEVQAANPELRFDLDDLEGDFREQWITDQWKKGQFKGNQISKYTTIRRAGEEEKLFGGSTLDESIGMAGQMMGQAILAYGFGGLGKLSKIKIPGSKTKAIAFYGSYAMELVSPTVSISQAYAQGVYEQTINKNAETFYKFAENELNKPEHQELINQKYIQDEKVYLNKAKYYFVNNGYDLEKVSDDEIVKVARGIAEAEYRQSFIENHPYGKEINRGALSAYWTSFGIEAVRYGQFFAHYRSYMFGDAQKALGLKAKTRHIGADGAVNDLTGRAIAKNFCKEAFNSGWTNLLDETTSAFATGLGTQQFNNYLGIYYNNNDEYNGLYGALLSGMHSAANSFTEKSTLRAGVIGSAGFFMGGNFANAASAWISPSTNYAREFTPEEAAERMANHQSLEMTTKEAKEELKKALGFKGGLKEQGVARTILEWAAYATGNSALQNITKQLRESDVNNKWVASINKTLSENEKLIKDNETARALANFATLHANAFDGSDEMVQKNTGYAQAFNLLRVLQEMRESGTDETDVYQNFMDKIASLENGEISMDDVQEFVNNPNNAANLKDMTDDQKIQYAKERIAKNVAKFREVEKSWEKNSKTLEATFGKDIKHASKDVQDIYYDTLFKLSLKDDFTAREANLEKELSGREEITTTTNDEVQLAIAREGTKTKLLDELSAALSKQAETLTTETEELRKKLEKADTEEEKSTIQKDILTNLQKISTQKELANRYRQQSAAYDQLMLEAEEAQMPSTQVLSKDEIMCLSPEERLFMLTNKESFSREQQDIIEELSNDLLTKFGKNYLSKIRDVHLLHERNKANTKYINNILQGNIDIAVNEHRQMRQLKAREAVALCAAHTLTEVMSYLKGNKVTKKLLTKLAGMPEQSLVELAQYLMNVNPAKCKALSEAIKILRAIRTFDNAISLCNLGKRDSQRAVNLFKDALTSAKSVRELPAILLNLHQSVKDNARDSKIVDAVLIKHAELAKLKNSTTEEKTGTEKKVEEKKVEQPTTEKKKEVTLETRDASEVEGHKGTTIPIVPESSEKKDETTKETPKVEPATEPAKEATTEAPVQKEELPEKAEVSEIAEFEVVDEETGEYRTRTPMEIIESNPEVNPIAKAPVTTAEEAEESKEDILGTYFQGNWVNLFEVPILKETHVQVEKTAKFPGSTFDRWLKWQKVNGDYQKVVDFELAKILEKNPNVHVRMLVSRGVEEIDKLIQDAIILAVEATEDVKKIHNTKYSDFVTANDGKEYLIIGRAGIESRPSDEAKVAFDTMKSAIQGEARMSSVGGSSVARFFVSSKYYTQVRHVQGGQITTKLLGDSAEGTHDVAEMLGDPVRDPFGLNKFENLGWYIQVGTDAREPIGLSKKVVDNGDYYIPANTQDNVGALFVMIPSGNGKFIPVKITAANTVNIKDGHLKDTIYESFSKLTSLDYNVRERGIKELLGVIVLNSSKDNPEGRNILIGKKGSSTNVVSIVVNGEITSFDLAKGEGPKLLEALKETAFRININQTTLQNPVKMKQYAEAGVFRTDVAVLGCTGNNFSVYPCSADGTPTITETNASGSSTYKHQDKKAPSVVYNGNIARIENGKWVVESLVEGKKIITSPTEIEKLNYSLQIDQQHLSPMQSLVDNSPKKFKYYIISSSKDNPIVVKRNDRGEVVIAKGERAQECINRETAFLAEKAAKELAAEEAKRQEIARQKAREAAGTNPTNPTIQVVPEAQQGEQSSQDTGEDTEDSTISSFTSSTDVMDAIEDIIGNPESFNEAVDEFEEAYRDAITNYIEASEEENTIIFFRDGEQIAIPLPASYVQEGTTDGNSVVYVSGIINASNDKATLELLKDDGTTTVDVTFEQLKEARDMFLGFRGSPEGFESFIAPSLLDGNFKVVSKVSKENTNEDDTNPIIPLQGSENCITFAEVLNNPSTAATVVEALLSSIGPEVFAELGDAEALAAKYKIPKVVQSVDALLDVIKNCRH